MMFYPFYAFIFFLIGLISSIYNLYFFILLILPVLYLQFYRKIKTTHILILLLFSIIGFLSFYLFPKGNINNNEILGIVISRSDNYYQLLTLKGKFYIKSFSNNANQFSILKLTGSVDNLSFSHYEGSFDFISYLNSKGIYCQFSADKTDIIFDSHFSLKFIEEYSTAYLNEDSKEIFLSFIFSKSITSSNLNHLNELNLLSNLSASGFHITFFLSSLFIFTKDEVKRKWFKYVKLCFVIFFLFFTSFSYSFRRIFILCICSIVFKMKRYKKFNLSFVDQVATTAIIMLIIEPYSLQSPSFYYSFPFLFYIGLFKKNEYNFKSKIKNSFDALLFFLPITIFSNKYFSTNSLIIQLFILPYSHLLFLMSFLILFCPPIGYIFNYLILLLLNFTELFSRYNYYIPASLFITCFIVTYYLIFIIKKILKIYNFKRQSYVALSLYLVPFSFITSNYFIHNDKIVFLDVDQGDCTFLNYNGLNILFDTGGKVNTDLATKCLIPYFRRNNIKKLDYVFITHLDYDHYGALDSLKNNFTVDYTFYNTDFNSSNDYKYKINDEFTIYNLNRYEISDEKNDNSAVYFFTVNDKKILIQGDAPQEIETKIINDNKDLHADIIKLGHHGSKTSSNLNYLKQIQPSLAIISCGLNNSYSLPSQDTLKTLNALNISYRRTDYEGSISIDI